MQRLYVASAALGGRRQPVDVYLPPRYDARPTRHYPVFYLLHGFPGRPGAFLQTVRAGVVEADYRLQRLVYALACLRASASSVTSRSVPLTR